MALRRLRAKMVVFFDNHPRLETFLFWVMLILVSILISAWLCFGEDIIDSPKYWIGVNR